jgi:hypothetical protein
MDYDAFFSPSLPPLYHLFFRHLAHTTRMVRITFKTLQQKQFFIEAELTETVRFKPSSSSSFPSLLLPSLT